MSLTQAPRTIHLSTPLGDDELLLTKFEGEEAISELFQYKLTMISENDSISPRDIVGKEVGFSILQQDGDRRYFHGVVSHFVGGDEDMTGRRDYTAIVVPWFWLLTRTSDCRIFQNMTTLEIVEQILRDLKFTDYEIDQVRDQGEAHEYCVQYRESDYAFVSRLLEEAGIYYYFRCEQDRHVMVMGDDPDGYLDLAESEVDYVLKRRESSERESVGKWEHGFDYRSGRWSQIDYNFETPLTRLLTTEQSIVDLTDNRRFELYDFPGLYSRTSEGRPITRHHMEEEELDYDVADGAGTVRCFAAGGRFKFAQHHNPDEQGQEYVLTTVRHEAVEPLAFQSGDQLPFEYKNQFRCIPSSIAFTPHRDTPKPLIHGVQTAFVVGPEGDEIYTDEYGRIKVQFHWDREGEFDENSSCWIRCAQASAGKRWGAMFIPRIGQEVVVSFLEGDPDRPLVTGVVYNAEQMPPYDLPGEKNKSYVKTNSTLGGEGYNELRIDDTADREQIFMHAQRNMDERVLNDRMERILNDRHLIVGQEEDDEGRRVGDQCEEVWRDKHLTTHGSHFELVDGNLQLTVGDEDDDASGHIDIVATKKVREKIGDEGHDVRIEGCRKEHIGGSHSQTIGGEERRTVECDQHWLSKGDLRQKVDGTHSMDVGMDVQEKVGLNRAMDAGMEVHIKAGLNVIIEAGVQISLVGPGGFIDIGPAGVAIQGTTVLINSGGAAGSGSGCSPDAPEDPAGPDEALVAEPATPREADDSRTGQSSVLDFSPLRSTDQQ